VKTVQDVLGRGDLVDIPDVSQKIVTEPVVDLVHVRGEPKSLALPFLERARWHFGASAT
jgi:hypothetical protein